MHILPFRFPAHAGAVLVAFCLTAVGQQPNPPAGSSTAAAPSQAAPSAQPAPTSALDDQWLAGVASLYYSSAKSGLNAFECVVHPDWNSLFASAQKDSAAAADPRVSLLNTVKITLHGRMKGGSTLDWTPAQSQDRPLDPDSVRMLGQMRAATESTLEGFMQFWTPFVNGSIVPIRSAGLQITHSAAGHTIYGVQSGTEVTEIFNNGEILQQFNVKVNGASIEFMPAYQSTEKGLLVNRFVARIVPTGASPGGVQEMHVRIEYQTVGGFFIPGHLSMEISRAGAFNFMLDGCTVNPPDH